MLDYRIGILGAGRIAAQVADTLSAMKGFVPYAIASRDLEKAKQFASDHDIANYYGSYDELLKDPNVDMVYIATVHSTHAELAMKAIDAGKPSLVEKPFSYNLKTCEEVLKHAEEKKVFCGEAMWLRYMPMMVTAVDALRKGVIGEIRTVIANTGYDLKDKERVMSPATAGGALLDVGIYPITAILMIMGEMPQSLASSFAKTASGVDGYLTLQMAFSKGRMATASSTLLYNMDNTCTVYGTNGRMEIDNINHPTFINIFDASGKVAHQFKVSEKEISGYEYEFIAAQKAAILGELETPQVTMNWIRTLYRFTDTLRATWGITYPLPGEAEGEPSPTTMKA